MVTLSWNPPFDDNGEATMLITYFTRRFGKIIIDPKVYMFVLNRDDYVKFGEHHRFVAKLARKLGTLVPRGKHFSLCFLDF